MSYKSFLVSCLTVNFYLCAQDQNSLYETSIKNFSFLLSDSISLDNIDVGADGVFFKTLPVGYLGSWNPWNYFQFDHREEKVRNALEKMIRGINSDKTLFTCHDDEIRFVFLEKLVSLSKKYFNPSVLYDMQNLQHLLVPELGQLRSFKNKEFKTYSESTSFKDYDYGFFRKKFKSLKLNADQKKMDQIQLEEFEKYQRHYYCFSKFFLEKNPEFKLDIAIAKAKLMFLLNIGISINKGSTRSYIVNWFQHKNIGIFKAEEKQETWSEFVMAYVKDQLKLQVSYLKTAKMARPKAEVAAYLLSNHLGMDNTRPTAIAEFKKVEGSFQLFITGFVEAKVIKDKLNLSTNFSERTLLKFQEMTILDYLMGDLDGHEENWLVRGSNESPIEELYKIDNANSFPQRNPTESYINDLKQYVWSELAIAKHEYHSQWASLIKMLSEESIEAYLEKTRFKLPGFMDSDMKRLLFQRAKVLRFILSKPGTSPRILGQLKTDAQILRFIDIEEKAEYSDEASAKCFFYKGEKGVSIQDDYMN